MRLQCLGEDFCSGSYECQTQDARIVRPQSKFGMGFGAFLRQQHLQGINTRRISFNVNSTEFDWLIACNVCSFKRENSDRTGSISMPTVGSPK